MADKNNSKLRLLRLSNPFKPSLFFLIMASVTVGQPSKMRSESRSTPAIPTVTEVNYENRRTNTVRLLPNGGQHRKLLKLTELSSKLYNEVNYERRQQFFKRKNIDFKTTWSKYYQKYKDKLGVNAQAVLQKNNEAWSSFFTILKLKKEGKPPHMHVSPPRYWKENGKRKKILVIRQDRYEVDEEKKKIILKDFKMEIDFVGRLRWGGKQGRLEIIYDDYKYAHILVEVGVETTRTGKKSKYLVHGERNSIQIAEKGNKVASIDLGINILASVVVNDGTWLLFRGTRIKEDYFYFEKGIAKMQSLADKMKNMGELEAFDELEREKRGLFKKLQRRFHYSYRTLVSLVKKLYELGVFTIYLGYPYNISQNKGNKFTVNVWSYRKLMNVMEMRAQEYGIKVCEVVEYNTSCICVYHDVEVERKPRGVITCPFGHKLHSDLNGALNILKLATKIVKNVEKPLSYFVFHNGVVPVKGCDP